MNKFYSLQRRIVEESLKIAVSDIFKEEENSDGKEEEEDEESENIFNWSSTICDCIQVDYCPAVVLHLADVFIESLEKAFPKMKPGDQLLSDFEMNGLLVPFYDIIQFSKDTRVVNRVIDEVFCKILKEEFNEKYELSGEVEKFDSELEEHNFNLSATKKYFPYFDGIEEALLSIATNVKTLEQNRSKVFDLYERYQKIRVPPKPKSVVNQVVYKPPTSEEVAASRKRKPKKKRKKPATMKPPKKKIRLQ